MVLPISVLENGRDLSFLAICVAYRREDTSLDSRFLNETLQHSGTTFVALMEGCSRLAVRCLE